MNLQHQTTVRVQAEELKQLRDKQVPHQLIDIRENYEILICNIGGMHIPMGEILDRKSEIPQEIPVIVHCRTGKRAAAVVDTLQREGFDNVENLEGGIFAWIDTVDQSLERY